MPGDYIYEDWNGDGTIDDMDKYPIATTTNASAANFQDKKNYPLMNFGLTLSAQWKGFDVSMTFQGSAMSYVSYGEQLSAPLQFDGNALDMFWIDGVLLIQNKILMILLVNGFQATTHMVEQHLIRILSLPFRKVHICA